MSEQSKGVVSLKAGFIYQKLGATEGEPVIDASGMSDKQIFGWMESKTGKVLIAVCSLGGRQF
ncbi:TPA: hypothetical protein NDX14_001594 [Enterobacter hormaechei]|nr:hypothetical protein [Enterobacter hormaechei]